MKKIIALLLLPLMVITFVSCKPEEKEKPKKLLKKIDWILYNDNPTYQFTYYYDNQNRLIKTESFYATQTLNYSTNTITMTGTESKNLNAVLTSTFQLDNNGYLLSWNFNNSIGYNSNKTYNYENGFIKELNDVFTEKGSTFYCQYKYSWMNGNIMQCAEYHNDSTLFVTNTYEYDSRKNLLNIKLFFEAVSVPLLKFIGITSKNYVVKSTYTEYCNNIPCYNEIYTFDYKFDKDGYPTQIIQTCNGKEGIKIILTYY